MPVNDDIQRLMRHAIYAETIEADELSDVYHVLDGLLAHDPRSENVRRFFDAWADALNHDFAPYDEKEPAKWRDAAKEIYLHYSLSKPLPSNTLWQECAVNVRPQP